MTTIRKIVTSKIDGDTSNNNSFSEVRPYGEAAFYQNTNEGGINKLELLIFDGERTHIRSKVLAKGRLYGGDADSSDGSGLDTIKLIPDAQLHYDDGQFGNHQYLVVDPTAPNHIHVRAGGTIDQSNADLFLGGERNNVRVSDGFDIVSITTDAGIEGTHTWTFDNSGQLLIPGGSNGRITEDEPGVVVYSDTGFAVQTNAGSPVSSFQVEFIGFIDDGFGAGVAGATLHVTEMIAGTITDGMTIYGNDLPPEGWQLTFGSAFEPVGAGGGGYYTLNGANFLTSSQSFNNNVPEANGPKNWIFSSTGAVSLPTNAQFVGDDITVKGSSSVTIKATSPLNPLLTKDWSFDGLGKITFPDSTQQTTAYPGITTVAKTGGSATLGTILTFSVSPSTNFNWQNGNYNNIVVGDLTINFLVGGGGPAGGAEIGNFSTTGPHSVGDQFVIDGALLGGTSGVDDYTLTVATIDPIPPTALDLSKTTNKLASGLYTLADGVEGQIMYLVPQDGMGWDQIDITVAHGRPFGDAVTPTQIYTDIVFYPFASQYIGTSFGVVTMIFTDGAWQASAGTWD